MSYLKQHVGQILAANARLKTVTGVTGALAKAREELEEVSSALAEGNIRHAAAELGDLLLAVELLAGSFESEHCIAVDATASATKVRLRQQRIETLLAQGFSLADAVRFAKAEAP